MKRKNNLTTPALALLLLVMACNCNFSDWVKTEPPPQNSPAERNSNTAIVENSDTDSNSVGNTGQTTATGEKSGIAECDEFISYIEQNSEEIGKDSMVARGLVEFYKQTIYSKLREGIGNSTPQEKQEIAKQCKLALEKLKEQNASKQ